MPRPPIVRLINDQAAVKTIETILEEDPAFAKERLHDELPLHEAAKLCTPNVQVIHALLAAYPGAARVGNEDYFLPLHLAVRVGSKTGDPCYTPVSAEVVQILLQAYPEAATFGGLKARLPLHFAAARSEVDEHVALALVNVYCRGAQAQDCEGQLPLHRAAKYAARIEVVKALLEAYPDGAKVKARFFCAEEAEDGKPSWKLPLHFAAQSCCKLKSEVRGAQSQRRVEVLRTLLRAFPQGAREQDAQGMLPLHMAVKFHAGEEVVGALLEEFPEGARVRTESGCLPLHFADADAVGSLIAQAYPKAVYIPDNDGIPPLRRWLERAGNSEEMRTACLRSILMSCGTALKGSCAQARVDWFMSCLQEMQAARGPAPPPVLAIVRRGAILEGLCGALHRDMDLLGGLTVQLHGESGAGDGIVREVMASLVAEFCNEDAALFEKGLDSARRLHPSTKSCVQIDHLAYFELIGKLIGVALSGREHLPADFSIPLLKTLLRQPLVVEDLCGVDAHLYRNLVEYYRNLEEDELQAQKLTFTYQEERFGSIDLVDLLGCGGAEQPVETRRDLETYLKTLAHYLMIRRVEPQLRALRHGLCTLIPDVLLEAVGRCFTADEFSHLIAGDNAFGDAMVDDWQKHSLYKGYSHDDVVVIRFWRLLRLQFSPKERAELLHFIHGCPRAPLLGFKHLTGYDGSVHQFTIVRVEPPSHSSETREAYPRAQTCLNTLWLPAYGTDDEMERRLRAVMSKEAMGFDEAAVAA